MFVIRSEGGRVAAAYLDEQFLGQEWLPIDSGLVAGVLGCGAEVEVEAIPRIRRQHLGQIRR